jgi:hypothetical protein
MSTHLYFSGTHGPTTVHIQNPFTHEEGPYDLFEPTDEQQRAVRAVLARVGAVTVALPKSDLPPHLQYTREELRVRLPNGESVEISLGGRHEWTLSVNLRSLTDVSSAFFFELALAGDLQAIVDTWVEGIVVVTTVGAADRLAPRLKELDWRAIVAPSAKDFERALRAGWEG